MLETVAVSLIFIDNHDEVMDTVEEIRRPLLSAFIDRKIAAFGQQVDGIVKKFEKDKYIFVFPRDKVEYLKTQKFNILELVRKIDMGNPFPVTLSIGIGLEGSTLIESMEFARSAIDLALSRGGDQVIIKNRDKYEFYGGKTETSGKDTQVRARVKAFALAELILESSDVMIMGHKAPDPDSLGAAIGVSRISGSLDKRSSIIINSVNAGIDRLYNMVIEAKGCGEGLFINSEQGMDRITPNTLLIIVDTHRPSIMECPELIDKAKKIVVFDHHRKCAEYVENPVLAYHEPYASSTCELITDMLLYMNNISLLPVEADALLAGITVDTKNFVFKTGTRTFEAAAYLRRNGADTMRVRELLQNDMESYKTRLSVVSDAEIYRGYMAISICKPEIDNPELIVAQAADDLLNIRGIAASFVICLLEDTVHISARSMGEINVQMIMERLNGGGHQTMAGAQLTDITTEKAIIMLKESIDNYMS